jgi:hypothetical protein
MARRPSFSSTCVADRYADKRRERIAEFSFPDAPEAGGVTPGGLIRLAYRDGAPPLVELYRVEGCEIRTPPSAEARAVLASAAEYVERFADLNGEPKGGNCRRVLAQLRRAAGDAEPEAPSLRAAARLALDELTTGKAAQGLDVNPYSLPAVKALAAALGEA